MHRKARNGESGFAVTYHGSTLTEFFQVKSCTSLSSDIRFFEHHWLKQMDCCALISLLLEELFKVNKIHKAVTNYKVTEMTIHFLTLSSRGNCGHT